MDLLQVLVLECESYSGSQDAYAFLYVGGAIKSLVGALTGL